MTPQTQLEIKGTLRAHPFAELLTEISETRLTGSFRLSCAEQKAVVYLKEGKVIFAVSNARQFRLFEALLRQNKISKERLLSIPNFTGDFELAEALEKQNLLSKAEIDRFFAAQTAEIIKSIFSWDDGEWLFSPLARIKNGLEFEIDAATLLLEYARSLAPETIVRRYKSFQESFAVKPKVPSNVNLTQQEAFILSRFESSFLKVEDVKKMSALSDAATLQILYSLWLGGFLYRQNWQTAFSEKRVSAILNARLSLRKNDPAADRAEESANPKEAEKSVQEAAKSANVSRFYEADRRRRLDEYLKRVEEAESYYEMLEVTRKSSVADIKTAYFTLAKRYHPDKFHQEANQALQTRIQNAFTEIAKAYETLKDESSRELYDFRLRKHLASIETNDRAEESRDVLKDIEEGRKAFEQGYGHLIKEEFEKAIPFFARAVQLVPDSARYHAYYGKLLAADETTKHKAESSLQTAVNLDPKNSSFRMMLAEFYAKVGLLRRAEGELERLLAQFPNNAEARAMLDALAAKR